MHYDIHTSAGANNPSKRQYDRHMISEALAPRPRARPSIRPTFSSHAQSRTQAQKPYSLGCSEVIERIK